MLAERFSEFEQNGKTESELIEEITTALRWAKDEIFVDGMYSSFSDRVFSFMASDNERFLNIISEKIKLGLISFYVLSELLRCIGRISEGSSFDGARILLQECLMHESSQVRDGAILGLSFLEDPQAIPALELALIEEKNFNLREDIASVIWELNTILKKKAEMLSK